MVRGCSAIGCPSHVTAKSGLSLHKFPKNEGLRRAWVLATERANFTPSDSSTLCSKHFNEEDYISRFGFPTLKKDAVPSVFNFLDPIVQKKGKTRKPLKTRVIPVPKSGKADMSTNTPRGCWESISPNVDTSSSQDPLNISSSNRRVQVVKVPASIKILRVPSSIKIDNPASEISVNGNLSNPASLNPINVRIPANIDLTSIPGNSTSFVLSLPSPNLPQSTTEVRLCTACRTTGDTHTSARIKRRPISPNFVSQCSESDLDDPAKAKRNWKLAMLTISKQKQKIKTLHGKIKRLEKRLAKLKDLTV